MARFTKYTRVYYIAFNTAIAFSLLRTIIIIECSFANSALQFTIKLTLRRISPSDKYRFHLFRTAFGEHRAGADNTPTIV